MPIESVYAEVTGKVWKVMATPGTQVAAEDTLFVVESMKMEIPVTAPCAGRLHALEVGEGDDVSEGQRVASIDR
ncbi:MAG: biotin/lipoyl-binding carrier protein [Burkholderiaceae bacterium]|nr:biotin/lipoyl-binding carrier protein [Pseudomonadota bacterium]MBS0596004.1 biotin/lipoyl-binding carrier protein [Pseudomonadota bacterium]MCO5116664.1 biotin/lipoyl-binding carrier protein [Burkholderiaceae bacterium]MCP5218477.1 biotin/lipoyl-binding carrier protein [Burkholderiaceae bacterium]